MNTVASAAMGLRSAAIIGSMTISRVMNPEPPMKGVNGMNVVMMYVAARPATSVSSAVLGTHGLLFSGLINLPPYSGVFLARRNGWEAPLTRLKLGPRSISI